MLLNIAGAHYVLSIPEPVVDYILSSPTGTHLQGYSHGKKKKSGAIKSRPSRRQRAKRDRHK